MMLDGEPVQALGGISLREVNGLDFVPGIHAPQEGNVYVCGWSRCGNAPVVWTAGRPTCSRCRASYGDPATVRLLRVSLLEETLLRENADLKARVERLEKEFAARDEPEHKAPPKESSAFAKTYARHAAIEPRDCGWRAGGCEGTARWIVERAIGARCRSAIPMCDHCAAIHDPAMNAKSGYAQDFIARTPIGGEPPTVERATPRGPMTDFQPIPAADIVKAALALPPEQDTTPATATAVIAACKARAGSMPVYAIESDGVLIVFRTLHTEEALLVSSNAIPTGRETDMAIVNATLLHPSVERMELEFKHRPWLLKFVVQEIMRASGWRHGDDSFRAFRVG